MIYKKIEDFIEKFREEYDVEYLKKQFKNVYFIIGTAYAGKSTMIKMLSEYYDGIMCEENYTIKVFKEYGVNLIDQPNLCYTDNHSMEEFVTRTPDDYYNWLDRVQQAKKQWLNEDISDEDFLSIVHELD